MRAVLQRVKEAWVRSQGEEIARIGKGLLVLLGVAQGDGPEDVAYMASKIPNLRIFEDSDGRMNLSIRDVGGEVLVVSQFTLLGDCRKGRRPSFSGAAGPEVAKELYLEVVRALRGEGLEVKTGRFQARMEVGLVNDGPVTLLLDSKRAF
ncbi:MAG: D-tyrosyl-tRNA(Tyr) deacylase [Deltaproteobacteria bacterium]|nr:MAG: D-tyrosyl-tRNA(Tyr) deacylase [Deltaproteobacteria bacterium]